MINDSDDVAGFTPKTAQRLLGLLSKGKSSNGQYTSDEAEDFGARLRFFAITSDVGGGEYHASEKVFVDGVPVTPDSPLTLDSGGPLVVIGAPKMKVGTIVFAFLSYGRWIGVGYQHRQLDWGTGAQSPFVFEGDVMKIKTWTTTDGTTWTQEKINIDTEPC